jgi:hypothetical protein
MLAGEWRFDGVQELLTGPLKTSGVLPFENVEKIYSSVAREAGKQPLYFAEKCPPGLDFGIIQQRLSAFRCLLLVRDPRDVILSVRAFNKKRGFFALREQEGMAAEELIIEFKRGYTHIIDKMSSIQGAHLIRYEDIVLQGAATLRRLFDWLDIDDDETTIERCVSRAASMENGQHLTSASLRASVERWRREMPEAWQELFAKHFGPILQYFDYPAR